MFQHRTGIDLRLAMMVLPTRHTSPRRAGRRGSHCVAAWPGGWALPDRARGSCALAGCWLGGLGIVASQIFGTAGAACGGMDSHPVVRARTACGAGAALGTFTSTVATSRLFANPVAPRRASLVPRRPSRLSVDWRREGGGRAVCPLASRADCSRAGAPPRARGRLADVLAS